MWVALSLRGSMFGVLFGSIGGTGVVGVGKYGLCVWVVAGCLSHHRSSHSLLSWAR